MTDDIIQKAQLALQSCQLPPLLIILHSSHKQEQEGQRTRINGIQVLWSDYIEPDEVNLIHKV